MHVVVKILLKALANLPHTDFVLCKCLLSQEVLDEPQVIFGSTWESNSSIRSFLETVSSSR